MASKTEELNFKWCLVRLMAAILANIGREHFHHHRKFFWDTLGDIWTDEDFQWVPGNRSVNLGGEMGTREVI